eukprot:GHRR01023267.1.p1 GENE.GHRR01023267.1~~GHRR01023267.1.p1  ORF type:complete len:354 (+),score=78.69 GHRR01023267.1:72-1133(+)
MQRNTTLRDKVQVKFCARLMCFLLYARAAHAYRASRMAERLTMEHYIGECFLKCAQVILSARIYRAERKQAPEKRSARWQFHLEVDELTGLPQRLQPWRRDIYAPMVIEVFVQPWDPSSVMPTAGRPVQQNSNSSSSGEATAQGMLLERWTLSYNAGTGQAASATSRAAMDGAALYKRLILLVRSLYSYVRVLPAYRMYRACKRHKGDLFNTSYSVSTFPLPLHHPQQQHQQPAVGGGLRDSNMCQFNFTPVETASGAFSIAVEYQSATTVHFLEQTTIPPSMPRIIPDYIDGPYARSAPTSAGQGQHEAGRHGGNQLAPGRTAARDAGEWQPETVLARQSTCTATIERICLT